MGGLGLGVDRLIMLLAGEQDPERPGTVVRQPGIRETILFPLTETGVVISGLIKPFLS